MKKRISQSFQGALILSGILSGWAVSQYGDSQTIVRPSTVTADRKDRFITAFDWLVDKNPEFIWPFESLPPAPYDSVRMVVERMPRVVDEKRKEQKSEPLIASRHLKINGRLQKPVRLVRGPLDGRQREQQEFLVKLDQGRLRLMLTSLPGRTFDPEHQLIRVKLYER